MVLFDEAFILQLAKSNASFLEFNHRQLHNHIRQLQRRILQLQKRYRQRTLSAFRKGLSDLLLRVLWSKSLPIWALPESLSRVRRELAQQNRTILS